MKRKNLTTAIVAGLAGVAGISSISNAMNVNSDGTGQVLIYPYYTVNNGNDTLISIVNTTMHAKAVKVRFLEGKNSREVLDFNLYLSPYDVWTAALTAVAETGISGVSGPSGKLITADKSCISPRYIMADGQEFLPYSFSGDLAADNNMQRSREGHFEMIEMGTLDPLATAGGVVAGGNNAYDDVVHVAGDYPPGCDGAGMVSMGGGVMLDRIDARWGLSSGVSYWDSAFGGLSTLEMENDVDFTMHRGGLFGSASIINPVAGFDVSYNAMAVEAFSARIQHTNPGNTLPNIGSQTSVAGSFPSALFNNGTVVNSTWTNGVDSMSALMMHKNIYNEYALDNSIKAKTEWVVTFPTKGFYVNTTPAIVPFTKTMSSNGACEQYTIPGLYDREEQNILVTDGNPVCPSPRPPTGDECTPDNPVVTMCWETNVLQFHNNENPVVDTDPSLVLGSVITQNVPAGNFSNGWMNAEFTTQSYVSNELQTYSGLPVTGFAIQKYDRTVEAANRGEATVVEKSVYGGIFGHKYNTIINS